MRELPGDIWDYVGRADIVIPTSLTVSRTGKAVMGKGVAAQAARRYPEAPDLLGRAINRGRDGVHIIMSVYSESMLGSALIHFPTKYHWKFPSDLALIERSADQLATLQRRRSRVPTTVLPRVGCGEGGLDWEPVRAILDTYLDDTFIVVTP